MNHEPAATDSATTAGDYQVVARRYRPQTFDELIGQQHVARALTNAISSNRIGHAYLFTGARGVGKTSAARIFAKALCCQQGLSANPCNQCDICESISAGSDVDVLEIDGASNRGIDEIRSLRQNVNIRPSRARYKIYIIDEVHMLTREAFNALLKTLEEPPEHVKFIFCTTEANKIPITILSRCQRFDFAGIRFTSIVDRLSQIVAAEGATAEPAVLETIARRAAGSMRDSQSLLEQLLAFGGQNLTAADVQSLLGTAGDARLSRLLECLVARDAAAALATVDTALAEGTDVGQLLEQLLGYLRDVLVTAVGCPPDSLLFASQEFSERISDSAKQMGVDTILAMMQIVEQTLSRLRFSTQARLLLELALVRVCRLHDLDSLADLVAEVRAGNPLSDTIQKKTLQLGSVAAAIAVPTTATRTEVTAHTAASVPAAADLPTQPRAIGQPIEPTTGNKPLPTANAPVNLPQWDDAEALGIWKKSQAHLSGILLDWASLGEQVECSAPGKLVVTFPSGYNQAKMYCEMPGQLAELERALATVAGATVRVSFRVSEEARPRAQKRPAVRSASDQRQLIAAKTEHPFVQRAVELFAAEIVRVDQPPE